MQVAADWFIEYVSPAMVAVPLRAAPLLDETVTVILPLPVPLVGERFTQNRSSEVVQLQSECEAVTNTVSLPLFDPKLSLVGVIMKVQDGVGVTVNDRLPLTG